MTGNGDIHRLRQLGTTYSLVEAEPHADAICAAVRAGTVQVVAAPRSLAFAVSLMADLTVSEILPPGFWQESAETPLTVARRSPR